jgi:hypothetical protein
MPLAALASPPARTLPGRRGTRLLAPLLTGALLLTACGDDQPTAAPEPGTTSAAAAVPGLSPGSTPSAAAATAGASASPGAAPAASTGGGSGTGTGASAPATARTPAAAPSAAGRTDTTKATAAGTYTYDDDGTVTLAGGAPQPVDGTSTLAVDEAAGGAQRSVLQGDQGRTEQELLLRAAGSYVARLQITNAAFDKTFAPDPAALLVPDPADVGRTWSWTATSTDGKSTVRQSSRVTRTETLTIGGQRVETRVVETQVVVSGDASYRATQTTWYAPSVHLPVKSRQKGSGTASGFAFEVDVTSVLRSTRPA